MPRWTVFTVLLVLITAPVSAADIFTVEMTVYENDTVALDQFDMAEGSTTTPADVGQYNHGHGTILSPWDKQHALVLADDDGYAQYVHPVVFPFVELDDSNRVQKKTVFERLPYDSEAEHLYLIRGEDEMLFSLDIPGRVCTADDACPAYCQNKGVDSDCGDTDGDKSFLFWILIGIFLAAIIIILYYSIEWE